MTLTIPAPTARSLTHPKWTDASRAIAADIASTILQLEWQELQDSLAGEMVLYLAERSTPNRLPW